MFVLHQDFGIFLTHLPFFSRSLCCAAKKAAESKLANPAFNCSAAHVGCLELSLSPIWYLTFCRLTIVFWFSNKRCKHACFGKKSTWAPVQTWKSLESRVCTILRQSHFQYCIPINKITIWYSRVFKCRMACYEPSTCFMFFVSRRFWTKKRASFFTKPHSTLETRFGASMVAAF